MQNNLSYFDQYNLEMETMFTNTENSKANKRHKFRLTLADKLNLKDPNKNMTLVNLSIYYTWKNIKLHITTTDLVSLMEAILF